MEEKELFEEIKPLIHDYFEYRAQKMPDEVYNAENVVKNREYADDREGDILKALDEGQVEIMEGYKIDIPQDTRKQMIEELTKIRVENERMKREEIYRKVSTFINDEKARLEREITEKETALAEKREERRQALETKQQEIDATHQEIMAIRDEKEQEIEKKRNEKLQEIGEKKKERNEIINSKKKAYEIRNTVEKAFGKKDALYVAADEKTKKLLERDKAVSRELNGLYEELGEIDNDAKKELNEYDDISNERMEKLNQEYLLISGNYSYLNDHEKEIETLRNTISELEETYGNINFESAMGILDIENIINKQEEKMANAETVEEEQSEQETDDTFEKVRKILENNEQTPEEIEEESEEQIQRLSEEDVEIINPNEVLTMEELEATKIRADIEETFKEKEKNFKPCTENKFYEKYKQNKINDIIKGNMGLDEIEDLKRKTMAEIYEEMLTQAKDPKVARYIENWIEIIKNREILLNSISKELDRIETGNEELITDYYDEMVDAKLEETNLNNFLTYLQGKNLIDIYEDIIRDFNQQGKLDADMLKIKKEHQSNLSILKGRENRQQAQGAKPKDEVPEEVQPNEMPKPTQSNESSKPGKPQSTNKTTKRKTTKQKASQEQSNVKDGTAIEDWQEYFVRIENEFKTVLPKTPLPGIHQNVKDQFLAQIYEALNNGQIDILKNNFEAYQSKSLVDIYKMILEGVEMSDDIRVDIENVIKDFEKNNTKIVVKPDQDKISIYIKGQKEPIVYNDLLVLLRKGKELKVKTELFYRDGIENADPVILAALDKLEDDKIHEGLKEDYLNSLISKKAIKELGSIQYIFDRESEKVKNFRKIERKCKFLEYAKKSVGNGIIEVEQKGELLDTRRGLFRLFDRIFNKFINRKRLNAINGVENAKSKAEKKREKKEERRINKISKKDTKLRGKAEDLNEQIKKRDSKKAFLRKMRLKKKSTMDMSDAIEQLKNINLEDKRKNKTER